MEEKVKISMLCQFYGKLLTQKQCEFINDYYNNDLYHQEGREKTFRIRRKATVYEKDIKSREKN